MELNEFSFFFCDPSSFRNDASCTGLSFYTIAAKEIVVLISMEQKRQYARRSIVTDSVLFST